MKTKQVDLLNIFLVILSLVLAINLPFKLFLFSYAILGPLHYLTEIYWLKEQKYFMKSNTKWVILFFIASILISLYSTYKYFELDQGSNLGSLIIAIANHANVILLSSFLFAISLLIFKKSAHIIISLVISIILGFLAKGLLPQALLQLGVFLPTLIHVYVFTALFVFYGAIKAKSKTGFILGVVILIVPFVIHQIPLSTKYFFSQETLRTYIEINFYAVGKATADIYGDVKEGSFFLEDKFGIKAQIFIAFAYTYHYLNWFSKTSIIGWKKALTKKNRLQILIIWGVLIAIYLFDYIAGFIAVLSLSFLHVFLEFPLNIKTITAIIGLDKSK